MDNLFRVVSLQSSRQHSTPNSISSNRTSIATASSKPHHYLLQRECASAPLRSMDEEDFTSASASPLGSKYRHSRPFSSSITEPADLSLLRDLNIDLFSSPSSSSPPNAGGRWAFRLLLECARAVVAAGGRDSERVQRVMWMLNELSSPYGDVEQKVAACFLQGLFARVTSSGGRTLRSLSAASDRNCSFHTTSRTALRFQELSPWASFGHVVANGAIVESFLQRSSSASGTQRFHILDLSNTFCTQWPTLLEALATRSSDDAPHVSITTVVSASSTSSSAVEKVMKEIGQRMERFARLMGVPFRFRVVHHSGDLSDLNLDRLNLREGGAAALAVNCVNTLHAVSPAGRRRDALVGSLFRLKPLIVTVIEEEADLDGAAIGEDGEAFMKLFCESLRFFSAYFESLEESFPRTSEERLALERAAGRGVVDLLAFPASQSAERRGTAGGWSRRMQAAGFRPAAFSEDVADDARALLRRYREVWSTREAEGGASGMFLAWREQPVVWASAWKP